MIIFFGENRNCQRVLLSDTFVKCQRPRAS